MAPLTRLKKTAPGTLRKMDGYWAYVPAKLPPMLPPSWDLAKLESQAQGEVRELAGLLHTLANPMLLTHAFARREAVQSSRIEGTVTGYAGLIEYEATGSTSPANADAREVLNYVRALERGLDSLKELPLCLRIVREVHGLLLQDVRGNSASPGEYRHSAVWIGGRTPGEARFVPPPADEVPGLLGDWERFLHAESDLPLLIRIAIAHYQFEAIHPFLDGNGRTGRLFMLLQLVAEGVMLTPALDISDYIERNRQDYYALLTAVSEDGAWEAWIRFILTGFAEQAARARELALRLLELRREYHAQLLTLGRANLGFLIVDQLFQSPWVTMPGLVASTGKTYNAVKENAQRLVQLGILEEMTGNVRDRIFIARGIIEVLEPRRS